MIEYLNRTAVCTWVVYDELVRRGPGATRLARRLAKAHVYPLDFYFLSKSGRILQRLASFRDLPGAHADVAHPHREQVSHLQVFMEAARTNFGG